MHNGFVRVDDEKMSKSLGNFFTIRDVLERYDPEVVRFFMLRAHYRSPLNYADALLDDARHALTRLYTALRNVAPAAVEAEFESGPGARFRAAMDDDFNTPEALAVLFELAGEVNRGGDPAVSGQLKALAGVLGLLQRDPVAFLQAGTAAADGEWSETRIEAMIAERTAAKKARDFARADAIRDDMARAGIVLEDSAAGTSWRRA